MISPRLRQEFANGEAFYSRAGKVIDVPDRVADQPNRGFLAWHADTVFRAR